MKPKQRDTKETITDVHLNNTNLKMHIFLKYFLIKKLLLFLIPSALLLANAEWKQLSNQQKINIVNIYKQGIKLDLGYTLAAIAWKESAGGSYLINLSDPSCGIFHTYLPSVLARHNIKDTSFNRNIMCQQLIDNPKLSLAEAVAEIRYWQVERKGNWFKVWASYNGGWKMNPEYAKDINKKILFLKTLLE